MALEAVVGGALGALARLAPEVLNFLDRKNERKHELAMAKQNLEITKLQNEGQLAIADREVEGKQFVSAMEAMKIGIEAQARPTGIKWIDAFSATVRPIITYWVFGLYSAVKTAQLHLALESAEWHKAILVIWSDNDVAMLSAVLTFWFVGRVWDRTDLRSFK